MTWRRMNGNMAYLANSRGCRAQSHRICYKSIFSSIPEFQNRNKDSTTFKDSLKTYLKAFAEKF